MLRSNQLIGFGARRASAGGADPSFATVKLLMGFEGADASTSFTDESSAPHTLSADGNAQIDTAQFKFGTSSLLLDGSGDDVNCGTNTNLNTATNTTPWTMEGFIRFNSTAGDQTISGSANPGASGHLWRMNAGSLDWFNWSSGGGTVSFVYPTFSPSTATWYYVCMDFDGTKTRMYTGTTGSATMQASLTQVQQLLGAANGWAIGSQAAAGGGGRYFNGWIDEFRFTTGVARYATDTTFLIPTAAFPRS